eukprot:CAMPEP_0174309742 /NCGR_PEP_ID=MMETSP0810-20121108/2606_1 /TAXON_ID=73025 ORGANISM="Eutreptiella gymnastica-like, Strain CCMP1594" /NCGR_SAMPLE_ID=MMETSP0810 /ASSEMBLY_ACC=CAM_ASM_000659 /LENGTH=139 /DNA_ID=CAMNT_0015417463 /DNA_START=697 /DNA_END=1114 /DNA_ORIENTATION=-
MTAAMRTGYKSPKQMDGLQIGGRVGGYVWHCTPCAGIEIGGLRAPIRTTGMGGKLDRGLGGSGGSKIASCRVGSIDTHKKKGNTGRPGFGLRGSWLMGVGALNGMALCKGRPMHDLMLVGPWGVPCEAPLSLGNGGVPW